VNRKADFLLIIHFTHFIHFTHYSHLTNRIESRIGMLYSAVDAAAAAADINVLAPSSQYLSQTLTLAPVYSPRELSQTRISSRHYKTAVQVQPAQQPSIHPADSETNRPSESNFLGMPHSS